MIPNAPPGDFNPANHPSCAVCRRSRCTPRHCRCDTRVCPRCSSDADDNLAYLVPALQQLEVAHIPGRGGGEKVRGSRTAPLPLRLDPLSLTAGGGTDDSVRDAYIPATHTWTELEDVRVLEFPDGQPTYLERRQPVAHRAPILDEHGRRVLVPAGDQTGSPPILVWARAWVDDWRALLDHAPLEQSTPKLLPPAQLERPTVGKAWVASGAARAALTGHLAAVEDAARRELARDVLGLGEARIRDGVRLVDGEDEADPYARAWAIHYGQPSRSLTLAHHIRYLRQWLPTVCERHPDVDRFASSLRALAMNVRYVLGDIDDRAWLGRCPTGYVTAGGTLVGRQMVDDGEPTVCGAGLWLEPFASQIVCPRCGTETGSRDQARLAGWIRQAWPVDRRRRYTLEEADEIQYATGGRRPDLRMPLCDHGRPVAVGWKDATERGDMITVDGKRVPRRMFRITSVGCRADCAALEEPAA